MPKNKDYDFGGWATRFNTKCSDGRTILPGAFNSNSGQKIPLVWNHNHNNVNDVLGHAILESRNEGMYAYCYFNNNQNGQNARELVKSGDITALSIYANRLKQDGNNVIHGSIVEVSLVLAGANPGAYIDNVIRHSADQDELILEEATIYNDQVDQLEIIEHSDKETEKETEIDTTDQKNDPKNEEELNHSDEEEKDETVQEIFDSLNEKQKTVVYALIGQAIADATSGNNDMEEDKNMKHNAFETQNQEEQGYVLQHSDVEAIFADAQRKGNLKDAVEDFALAHSITDVSNLFPEYKATKSVPDLVNNRTEWVEYVIGAVKKVPFARIKARFVDVTADNARAKGYVKGNQKVEEVISALKRTTDPQTVYKLQKLDRDDVIDITDFDVVSFVKAEMRLKLNEEIARAILIGDGRASSSGDKIDPLHIRPIWGDSSVYTTNVVVEKAVTDDEYTFAKSLIKTIRKNRKYWKGSGKPDMIIGSDLLTNMLSIEDTNGRVIYENEEQLAKHLRVNKIVEAEVLDGVKRTDSSETYDYNFLCMLVNLSDYELGNDKGGEVNLFDNFNLDYNKQEYLIETRKSGALNKAYSALTFEEKTTHVSE